MTSIESIKKIVYGDSENCDISDSETDSLKRIFGYNGTIRYLAIARKSALASRPTVINDGENSFSYADRMKVLDEIIRLADMNRFDDPEEKNRHISAWSDDLK